jgi:DNA invertase Pin-like site-specific DNA recombinase
VGVDRWMRLSSAMGSRDYAGQEELQIDALTEAGCDKWFVDKMIGWKAERKGLTEALAYLRPGDTLVVWKLDRAGRSLPERTENVSHR